MILTRRLIDLDIYNDLEVFDCPRCGGAGLLEEENGWCWYVMCMECGAQTIQFEYRNAESRRKAAEDAVRIWNMGKVVSPSPGE